MPTVAGLALLNWIRRNGSYTVLRNIPDEIFIVEDERNAIRWMRDFVTDHKNFPDSQTFANHTRLRAHQTHEPGTYYIEQAKRQAIYTECVKLFEGLRVAFSNKDVPSILETAKSIYGLEVKFNIGMRDRPFTDILDAVVEDYFGAKWAGGLRGVDTGYSWLNEATAGGWQGTDNIALAGRIADGKTYLALKHAFAAWKAGRSVLFLSMEMGAIQIARRMIGIETHLNPRDIARGRIGSFAERRLLEGVAALKGGVPFHCYAGNFVSSTMVLRGLVEEHMPDMIECDASYLLNPQKRTVSRRENLVDVANDLKKISLDTERPLLHTVQFNRTAVKETRKQKRDRSNTEETESGDNENSSPVAHLGLHKIAETDAVAANASLVLALSKLPSRDDRRYYVILKGREGERGVWEINYNFETMNFERVTPQQDEDERLAETEYMI